MTDSLSNIPPLFCLDTSQEETCVGVERNGLLTRKSNKNVTIISETRLEELRAQEDLRRKRLARKAQLARISRKQKREKMQNLESENVRLKRQLSQLTSLASLTSLTQDENVSASCKCHENIENCLKQSNYTQMTQLIDQHKHCLSQKLSLLQKMSKVSNLSQRINQWCNQANSTNGINVMLDNIGQQNGQQTAMATLIHKYQSLNQHESKLFTNLSNIMQDKYTILSQLCAQKQIKVEK